MEKEIEVAAVWWADQLRQTPRHDSGGGIQDAMISLAADKTRSVISEEQIERFRTELIDRWAKRNQHNWNPDEPFWGSSLRVLACDYGPGGELAEALEVAGITPARLVLPIKTVMWIDPGKVSVACGYGARSETLYSEQTDAAEA